MQAAANAATQAAAAMRGAAAAGIAAGSGSGLAASPAGAARGGPPLMLGYDPRGGLPAVIPNSGRYGENVYGPPPAPPGSMYGPWGRLGSASGHPGTAPGWAIPPSAAPGTGGLPEYYYGGHLVGGGTSGGGGSGGGGREPPDEPFMDRRSRMPPLNPYGAPEAAGHGNLHSLGIESGVAAYGGVEFLKSIYEASASRQNILANLHMQGFTPEEIKRAYAQANQTRMKVFGSSTVGNLEIISMLQSVLQNPEETLEVAPAFAPLGVVMGAFGQGDQVQELMAATRSAEYQGIFTQFNPKTGQYEFNTKKLLPYLHMMEVADVQTHGNIGPRQFLQFLRASGGAGAFIGKEWQFADNLALMMALGPRGAGTALKSFEQQFSAGKMSDAAVKLLLDMGILSGPKNPKHNPNMVKVGIGSWNIYPKAWSDIHALEVARENPTKFIDTFLRPHLKQWVDKEYAPLMNAPGVTPEHRALIEEEGMVAAYMSLASRIPGGTFGAETERNFTLMEKERRGNALLLGLDPATGKQVKAPIDFNRILQEESPNVNMQQFLASWDQFKASLGDAAMKPLIGALNDLSGVLDRFGTWAKSYPDGAKHALEGMAAGVGALAAISVAALGSSFIGTLGKAAGAAGLRAPASVAAAGGAAAAGAGSIMRLGLAGGLGYGIGETYTGITNWAAKEIDDRLFGSGTYDKGVAFNRKMDAQFWDGLKHFFLGGDRNKPVPVTIVGQDNRVTVMPPGGSSSQPVHVTGGQIDARMTNPGDIKHGVAAGLVHDSHGPQTGPTGSDIRADPWAGAFQAAVP